MKNFTLIIVFLSLIGIFTNNIFACRCSTIGNFVWEDLNKNGVQDNNEPGISGVEVILYNDAGYLGTTFTDANGVYYFAELNLNKNYVVQFVNPVGYYFTLKNAGSDPEKDSDADPTTGLTDPIFVQSENNPDWDAGLIICTQGDCGSIGDYVWEDLNGDGIQDDSEPGMAGAMIYLFDVHGLVDYVTTDETGYYLFDNLPANKFYKVYFGKMEGYKFTRRHNGGNENLDSDADPVNGETLPVFLMPNVQCLNIDAGYVSTQCMASFGVEGKVWRDLNINGLQDSTEPMMKGIPVVIYDERGMVNWTYTDENGHYIFSPLPNNKPYLVQFVLLEGVNFTFTQQDAGDDAIDSDANPVNGTTEIIYPAGTKAVYDAGLIPPPCVPEIGPEPTPEPEPEPRLAVYLR